MEENRQNNSNSEYKDVNTIVYPNTTPNGNTQASIVTTKNIRISQPINTTKPKQNNKK